MQGNAISNLVNKMDEAPLLPRILVCSTIWNDPEKLEDVTAQICEHIDSVYQENPPAREHLLPDAL